MERSIAESAEMVVVSGVVSRVLAHMNPCDWKKECVAKARALRTRKTAPKVLVRGRRCVSVRRWSSVWAFFARG